MHSCKRRWVIYMLAGLSVCVFETAGLLLHLQCRRWSLVFVESSRWWVRVQCSRAWIPSASLRRACAPPQPLHTVHTTQVGTVAISTGQWYHLVHFFFLYYSSHIAVLCTSWAGERRGGPLHKVIMYFPKLRICPILHCFSLESGQAVDVLHLLLVLLLQIIWLLPYLLICCICLVMERTEVSLRCAEDLGSCFCCSMLSNRGTGKGCIYLIKAKCVCLIPVFSFHLEDSLKARKFYVFSFLKGL